MNPKWQFCKSCCDWCCRNWKTFLIETIGRRATQDGISVLYWRFPQLLEKMMEAFNRSESSSMRRKIYSKRLLIIDDFAMAPLNDQMRTDLLSLIDDRLGIQSTIIAAQLPFKNWYQYIGEAYHADALIDWGATATTLSSRDAHCGKKLSSKEIRRTSAPTARRGLDGKT